MVQINLERPKNQMYIITNLITNLTNQVQSQIQRSYKKIQRLSPTRRFALLVFAICTCTSFSVIFITGNTRGGYHHLYYDQDILAARNSNQFLANYDQGSSNTAIDSISSSVSSIFSSHHENHNRQKAIENAKKENEKFLRVRNADEVELDSIIKKYKKEVENFEQQEKEQTEHEVAKKRLEQQQGGGRAGGGVGSVGGGGEGSEEAEAENDHYYLYYQDDVDVASTIIGLPSFNSDPISIKRFVWSLRQTGYGGNIIIGIDTTSNTSHNKEIITFLQSQNVMIKDLMPVECTFEFAKKNQKCFHPYSHIKREWSYFPLARDWLTSCQTCVGSVVFASVKDTIFQRNPFGTGMPIIQRLHLYELHPSVSTADMSAGVLLKACENIDLDKINTNLQYKEYMKVADPKRLRIVSAGIAVGMRDDVIDYLGAIHSVMREWMHRSQCHFEHSSDDDGMAIVNYLRLVGRLPYRTRIIPHRTGIVNNVGYDGRLAYGAHQHLWQFKGLNAEEADKIPYEINEQQGGEAGDRKGWIDSEFMLTDDNGNFIDVFFQKSAVIYGYGEFGPPFTNWLDKKLGLETLGKGKAVDDDLTIDSNGSITNNTTDDGNLIESSTNSTIRTNDNIQERSKDENDKNNDDYYIKENDKSAKTTTTSALNVRKVIPTTEVIAEQTSGALNSTKKENEKEQPMYYKDQPSNEDETVDASKEVEKTVQIVPVEETHEKSEDKKKNVKQDDQDNDDDSNDDGDDDAIDRDVPKARKKRRKYKQS